MENKRTSFRAFQDNGEEEEKSEDRRLSLREKKRISYNIDRIVYDKDKEQENEEKEKDNPNCITSGLPVNCGTKLGLMDLKKLNGGEPCIKCEGHLLTPPAFEWLAGKGSTKKWKASIFYERKPLSFWFKQGYLSTKGYNKGRLIKPKKKILPFNCKQNDLFNEESEMESAEVTEDDDDSFSSYDELASETEVKDEERKEGGKEEAGVNKEHPGSQTEDDGLEEWDTEDDVTDISDNYEDQTAVKEEVPKLINSTLKKLSFRKEVKIIIKRLSMARRDSQTNCMEHPPEDTVDEDEDEDDHDEVTDDSSATWDDLFSTSVTQTQPSQMSGEARTGSIEEEQEDEFKKSTERQDEQSKIKPETSSYEEEENGESNMCCGKENGMSKKEHLDVSISQYNGLPHAAEDRDLTSGTVTEQPLIAENLSLPILGPVSEPLCLLVHQNHTHVTAQLQGVTSNICMPQTNQAPDIAEETMDICQLKREKVKMQLRVLRLQEEYYTLKMNELKKEEKLTLG